jgi:hypothetical protein
MTDSGHVWFQYLADAYVQIGKFQVEETYLPGKHSMPRTTQVNGETPVTYPESFAREWATFATTTDASTKGYDPGAYGIGAAVHERTITVPRVLPVHLLYYYSVSGTKEERILVQVPSTGDAAADLGDAGLGVVTDDLTRITFSADEYTSTFAPAGFNRFGFVLPAGMSRSMASELHSFTGTFTDVDDASGTYTVYMEPMYINNDRPLFDFIYLQGYVTDDINGDVAGIEGRLLRWRGGIPSENIAPINRSGDALATDGYLYDVGANTFSGPQDQTLTIDGQAYSNADAYNVRNYKRQ